MYDRSKEHIDKNENKKNTINQKIDYLFKCSYYFRVEKIELSTIK